jgi:hypothetical protein
MPGAPPFPRTLREGGIPRLHPRGLLPTTNDYRPTTVLPTTED